MIHVRADLPEPLSPVTILILPGTKGINRGPWFGSFGQRIIFRIASLIRIGYLSGWRVAPMSFQQRPVPHVSRHLRSSSPRLWRVLPAWVFCPGSTGVVDLDRA